MTWFGKILVLVNLALSLMMAAWALALFTSRIDWSNQKGKVGKPDGELLGRQALTKELWAVIPQAEVRWRTARSNLLALEEGKAPDYKDGRIANRAWYEAELQYLRTGAVTGPDGKLIKRPVMLAVAFDMNRMPVPDPANFGRPKMVPATDRAGKPLNSLVYYNDEEKNLFVAIETEQKRLEEAVKKDTLLTEKLLGPKGLQARLIDERVRHEDVMAEHGLVKPQLINTYVDSELLLQRRRQLEQRLEQLKKTRAAEVTAGR
jgi:hypothetical protein